MKFLLALQTFRKLQLVALMSSMGEMMDPHSKCSAFHKLGSFDQTLSESRSEKYTKYIMRCTCQCTQHCVQPFKALQNVNKTTPLRPTSLVPCSSRLEIRIRSIFWRLGARTGQVIESSAIFEVVALALTAVAVGSMVQSVLETRNDPCTWLELVCNLYITHYISLLFTWKTFSWVSWRDRNWHKMKGQMIDLYPLSLGTARWWNASLSPQGHWSYHDPVAPKWWRVIKDNEDVVSHATVLAWISWFHYDMIYNSCENGKCFLCSFKAASCSHVRCSHVINDSFRVMTCWRCTQEGRPFLCPVRDMSQQPANLVAWRIHASNFIKRQCSRV